MIWASMVPTPTLAPTRYLIGRAGHGGPGIASCADLDALLATLPELTPGEYWVALTSDAWASAWGLAWVYSPQEWHLDGDGVSAGPGCLIV